MTPLATRRTRLQALLDGSTPGPWGEDGEAIHATLKPGFSGQICARISGPNPGQRRNNLLLIVTVRNELQSLLDSEARLERALRGLVLVCGSTGNPLHDFEEQAAAFNAETGLTRPGKDVGAASGGDGDFETRRTRYTTWVTTKIEAARAALGDEP